MFCIQRVEKLLFDKEAELLTKKKYRKRNEKRLEKNYDSTFIYHGIFESIEYK
jgi:hypothetical protein